MTIIPFSQSIPHSYICIPSSLVLFSISHFPYLLLFPFPSLILKSIRIIIEEMNTPPSSKDLLSKLVSRIAVPTTPVPPSSHPKQTNFSKYNRSLYLNHSRSFRSSQPHHFLKHNNLVQTNKENMSKLHTPAPTHTSKRIPFPQMSMDRLDLQTTFTPKRQDQIRSRYPLPHDHNTSLQHSSSNLQLLLVKNRMKNTRHLLGFNILHLQKRYNYSRFELHTLHSIFITLLIDCKHSLARFKDSFEVMLNMNRIAIRPQVLQKIFREQQSICFEGFIQMYSRIDQVIFKQSIIDYVQILFQGVYHKDNIRFEDIVRILHGRITEKEAVDIATIIYEEYDRKVEETVKLTEITELCHNCEIFAKKMYRLHTNQMRCD